MSEDRRLIRRALRLAERGWGRVEPNPLVGALVVRDGKVIAEGYHAEYGGPHAEIAALRAAGSTARGATLYVTLEPCAHYGKTPPCTDAIVRAGVRRVVFAAHDPNTQAAGGGSALEEAGIAVAGGVEESAARALNAPFFHWHERAGCYVALKLAMTLDAKLSRDAGQTTRITGPAAQRAVHRLRAGYDGILVGIGTVLADDPLLTVRRRAQPRVPPHRIVLDTDARLPIDARLTSSADAGPPVWAFTGEAASTARTRALEARGVRVVRGPGTEGGLDIHAVLDRLVEAGVHQVLCEGGGRIAASLLAADVVERMYLFYAPAIFGAGVDAFPFERPPALAGGWRLYRTRRYDQDVVLILDRQRQ